ncbi:MAG: ABC transporter substrate-binding protein [Desulfobacteraceae bacterium]|nr:ABC transporter substrate-binding protein [Desulfobacteraceae bacterium]
MIKKQYFLLFTKILFLFVLAGCQTSKDEIYSGQQLSGPVPVTLQLQWVVQAQFAGFYLALDKGWYLEQGIDLKIVPGGPDLIPVDLVASGARDFGTTLLADLVVSINKGRPVISIGQIQQNNGLRLIAKISSGIQSPKDFKGAKTGVWIGSWETQFNALMALSGVPLDQVSVVSQGWSMSPFIDGQLDVASAMIYNEYHKVIESGLSKDELIVFDYADYGLDFPGDVLFTSRKLVKENPDLCMKMLRASLRGWNYAMENQQEAVDIVLKYDKANVQTRDHQLKMIKDIAVLVKGVDSKIGHMDRAVVKRMTQLLVKYKLLNNPMPIEKIYTSEFLN